MTPIEIFVMGILKAKGMVASNPEVLGKMRDDLVTRLQDRIDKRIELNIPASHRAAFDKLCNSDASDEEVQEFCAQAIPNINELIRNEMDCFERLLLGERTQLPSSPPESTFILKLLFFMGITKMLSHLSLVTAAIVGCYCLFAGFGGWQKSCLLGGLAAFVLFFIINKATRFIVGKIDSTVL